MSALPAKIRFPAKPYHTVGTVVRYRMAHYRIYKFEGDGLVAFAKLTARSRPIK